MNKSLLKKIIKEKGLTYEDVYNKLEIQRTTFYRKLRNESFKQKEIDIMADMLEIKNPWNVFFGKDSENEK